MLPGFVLLNVASFDSNIKWTGCDLSHLRVDRKGLRITACTGSWLSPMENLPKPSQENTHTCWQGTFLLPSALNPLLCPCPRVALGLCKEDPPSLFSLSICWWGQAKGQLPRCAHQFGDSTAGLTWQGGRSHLASLCSAHSTPTHPPSHSHPHHSYSQPCLPEKVGRMTDFRISRVHTHLIFSGSCSMELMNSK